MTPNNAANSQPESVELLQRRIAVARGQQPGDLLLRGGQVVNVFTNEIYPADVVIADGWIAGVGSFAWEAEETIDLSGEIIFPGLIDAHMHLESTMLLPAEFARLVLPHGTTTVIADPHEVGNVLGARGIEMLIEASAGIPLDVRFMAPSCVPATPWEDAGAELDAVAIAKLLQHPQLLGLAEMMDVQGVLEGQPGVLEKIRVGSSQGVLDGHAPAEVGQRLVAYAAAGIRSDHESTTVQEALEKARLGMLVQVREGSMARNLDTLLPLLVEGRLGDSGWCLCTDDIEPGELLKHGHIDHLLRRLVAAGVPLATAVRHCTLVPARHYGLRDQGAIAPGYQANLVVASQADYLPQWVFYQGGLVAQAGKYLLEPQAPRISVTNTVNLGSLNVEDFRLKVHSSRWPTIAVHADQILTQRRDQAVQTEEGYWRFDENQDVVLVASIERHRATGKMGLGLATGMGLKRGALGSSVAHDSHNLIIAGTNPADMLRCAETLRQLGGGLVVVSDGEVVEELPLPFAGLISLESGEQVSQRLDAIRGAAHRLGCQLPQPFGTLSFLALVVIPELRITDRGLFDVTEGHFLEL